MLTHRSRPSPRVLAAVGLLALGIAGVVYARHIAWDRALDVMRDASLPLLVLASLLHFVSLGAKSGAWWICLRALGGPRFRLVARTMLVGATLNSLFVANTGEASRVVLITRASTLRSSAVLATVVLERLLGVLGFAIVVIGAIVWTGSALVPARVLAGAATIAALGLLVAVAAARSRRARRGPARTRLPRSVRRYVRRVAIATRRIVTPRRALAALALTLVDWSAQLASYHAVAHAVGLSITAETSLLALLAVNAGLVVRVTPGNVGVFELAYATAAHSRGAPFELALTVGLLIHLVQDVPMIAAGLAVGARALGSSAAPLPLSPAVSSSGGGP